MGAATSPAHQRSSRNRTSGWHSRRLVRDLTAIRTRDGLRGEPDRRGGRRIREVPGRCGGRGWDGLRSHGNRHSAYGDPSRNGYARGKPRGDRSAAVSASCGKPGRISGRGRFPFRARTGAADRDCARRIHAALRELLGAQRARFVRLPLDRSERIQRWPSAWRPQGNRRRVQL